MFSRRERLPRAQFPAALKAGRRFSSPRFMAVVPEGVQGYAVVVPKKVARLSVARHRLKRQMLEVMREFPLPSALILFLRTPMHGVHYEDIKAELGGLLSKIPT